MQSLEPVRIGMAGVIYLSPASRSKASDLSWLRASFVRTPRSRRTEWRSDDIFAITHEHADEVGGEPGDYFCEVPSAGDCECIAFGQYFGNSEIRSQIDLSSQQLLSAYQLSGPSAFNDVNGSWVGVIWERGSKRACIIRDVVGAQTLYAARLGDKVLFCTDLRVLYFSGLFDELDEQAIAEFLHYLYMPAPLTMMRNVHAVLPGHLLWLDEGPHQKRFASPRFVEGIESRNRDQVKRMIEDCLPEFEEHLLRAVSDCVPRDGRIALPLSGGKDSSTLAVALSRVCPDRVLTFNVGSADARYDETSDAALVSSMLGLAFQSYVPTEHDLSGALFHFLAVQDQPIGDPTALPYFWAMKNLPDDCHVIFDGTGDDYYFGFTNVGKGQRYERRLDIERNVPSVIWALVLRLMAFGPAWMRELGEYWARPIEETFVPWEGWPSQELSRLCGRVVSFEDTYLWKVMREGSSEKWITLLTNVCAGVWEPHTAYRKVVHLAHSLGKGVRSPFTDNRLARFINTLPSELKFEGGTNKVLLRAYMARHLPQQILSKPKSGFKFNLNLLLQNSEYPWIEDLNRQGLLRILPHWNEAPILQLLSEHAKRDHKCQHRLYALALLASVLAVRRGWTPDLVS